MAEKITKELRLTSLRLSKAPREKLLKWTFLLSHRSLSPRALAQEEMKVTTGNIQFITLVVLSSQLVFCLKANFWLTSSKSLCEIMRSTFHVSICYTHMSNYQNSKLCEIIKCTTLSRTACIACVAQGFVGYETYNLLLSIILLFNSL